MCHVFLLFYKQFTCRFKYQLYNKEEKKRSIVRGVEENSKNRIMQGGKGISQREREREKGMEDHKLLEQRVYLTWCTHGRARDRA